MTLDAATLTERLELLIDKYDVPSTSVAVLSGGEVVVAAAGMVNRPAGIETSTDAVYQIGSISKVYTTSLVLRLVDRGVLDLDEPVRTYLPELDLSDPDTAARVTLRHLLTHSSGVDGDHFEDTGRGDDCLEKYVATCATLPQQFPLGASHSYCNAGFVIVGRVLEKVTGKSWDEVLRDELVGPLGLEHTMTLPEEVLRHRSACGHVGEPGSVVLTPQWGIPRSSGPAGLICATPADVIGFARAVLDNSAGTEGADWLSAEVLAASLEPQVAVPNPHTLGAHWALGWILYNGVDGRRVFGHDGATLGQGAALRIVPDAGVAIVICSNGGGMADLHDTLLRELLAETAGVELKPQLAPVEGADGGDRSRQVGTYVRPSSTLEFTEHGESGLRLTIVVTSQLAEAMGSEPVTIDLLPVEPGTYVARMPGAEGWTSFVFFEIDGRPYVHFGARAAGRSA